MPGGQGLKPVEITLPPFQSYTRGLGRIRMMDKAFLLAQLKSLLERQPDFSKYSVQSNEHHEWLGAAHALVNQYDIHEAIRLASSSRLLSIDLMRESSIAEILNIIHRNIAAIQLATPTSADQVYGPGAEYDFFKDLSSKFQSATKSLFIIDQYTDSQIFDDYLVGVPNTIMVRILANKYAGNLKTAVQKFNSQHQANVSVKSSKDLHDRVVFVDDLACWVMGQSIKDAATSTKATYIAPLSPDVAKEKLRIYEEIWNNAADL